MEKKWSILSPEPDQVQCLTDTLGCHPVVATVLVNRNICTAEQAASFLKPSLAEVRSPFLMKDMDRAVDRILLALQRREKVVVFGDYDVDGITATSLLFGFLKHLDMDVDYHIPDRLTEGYGLSPEYVEKGAIARGINLIITVDCGISSHEAIRAAHNSGIDVIVTDHHEIPPVLPDAFAILNPKQPACPSGFTWLAGVGVAFNLVLALRKRLRDEHFWETRTEPNLKAACDLVALGTVADMVPILEENRIYVKAGLEVLASYVRPGVKALLDVCQITNGALDAWDVAFRLAPRLNAAGRLRHASMGLELLTTSSPEAAHTIAENLDQENSRRQAIEKEIFSEILRRLEANPQLLRKRALVLEQQGWHEGVIGIVASRLVERYVRPVVLIAVTDGMGKGSARSPEGLDLFKALKACDHCLEKFGGHQAAAGLTLKAENIPAFGKEFEKTVSRNAPVGLVPKLSIDAEISASEITPRFANELEQLAPFGTGNPEPLFMLSDMDVLSGRIVGARHMQMRLRPSNCVKTGPFDAILFNVNRRLTDDRPPKRLDRIACHVRWNRWSPARKGIRHGGRDRKSIQLVIKDFAAA
ncbi:MAG: single-stranded-DNA-specific exonuclease RecJ [Desulfobacterales bacterium]|nr:single-stranded-DNA-specific exonuclease RecJ [Desulfobacterales bacterium]